MNAVDSLCLAVGFLWLAAAVCYTMRLYHYLVAADLGMGAILICFSVLSTIKHNDHSLDFAGTATASQRPSAQYVTRPGDGFYHTADCERLPPGASVVEMVDRDRTTKAPCVDCVLPRIHRAAASR